VGDGYHQRTPGRGSMGDGQAMLGGGIKKGGPKLESPIGRVPGGRGPKFYNFSIYSLLLRLLRMAFLLQLGVSKVGQFLNWFFF
jgi:hypothetical protein